MRIMDLPDDDREAAKAFWRAVFESEEDAEIADDVNWTQWFTRRELKALIKNYRLNPRLYEEFP